MKKEKNNQVTGSSDSTVPSKSHILFFSIVVIGVIADLWTKHAIFQWLKDRPYEQFSIVDGFFRLVIRLNSGAAFSIATGKTGFLVAISVIVLAAIVLYFIFGRIPQKLIQIALALFTAGIIGNLYDRIFNDGYVRDFIDVYYNDHHWPAFNVADSMLCIAVGLLIIANITSASGQKSVHSQK